MQDWDAKAAWMRARGATDAEWAFDGTLVRVSLGPEPVQPDTETQPMPSAEERERRMRLERKRVALAASGGLMRRLEGE